MLLPHADTLPAHHELSNQSSMVAAFLAVELHEQPLTMYLI